MFKCCVARIVQGRFTELNVAVMDVEFFNALPVLCSFVVPAWQLAQESAQALPAKLLRSAYGGCSLAYSSISNSLCAAQYAS